MYVHDFISRSHLQVMIQKCSICIYYMFMGWMGDKKIDKYLLYIFSKES